MSVHEYVVREQDGLWGVWLDGRLISGQPTQMAALGVAEALAGAAAAQGGPELDRTAVEIADQDLRRLAQPGQSTPETA